jgi:isopenicillin-N epimerase
VGAEADDLVFVPNVTTAINAVLRSHPLRADDEILVTDHEYNASRNVADYVARERDARVVVAKVPFPLHSPSQVVEAVLAALGPRTRLALLDHVTSQTGLVFPLEVLIPELRARGVEVLVDGAHAPGMLPLDLRALGADYYTGNCHKWLCAPKSAGFLVVRRDLQEQVRPAVISHGANAPVEPRARFRLEFGWTGTRDPTPALAVPEALRFLSGLVPGGWPEIMRRNRALALEGRRRIAASLAAELPCPDEMIGSLAALPVPELAGLPPAPTSALEPDPLQEALFREHRIEVPVLGCPAHPGRLLRISAQLYNRIEDYERLAAALAQLLRNRHAARIR